MNFSNYHSRLRIKWLFFIFAILLLLVGFFFLNNTINDIRKEERKKVLLWADAVQQRNELLDYASQLFSKLQEEELQKVELWKESQQLIMEVEDSQFLTFLLNIISNNKNIPIVLTDVNMQVITSMNLDNGPQIGETFSSQYNPIFSKYEPLQIFYKNKLINYIYYSDSQIFNELQQMINNMIHSFIVEVTQNAVSVPVVITNSDTTEIFSYGNITEKRVKELQSDSVKVFVQERMSENQAIPIVINQKKTGLIFYEESELITKLRYYPIIILFISIIILIGAYLTFRSFEKHEKDQLWVGMSKETAHQLGTPISSLMAWLELLKMKDLEPEIVCEIDKDITRLNTIASRFSKIGSNPNLTRENIVSIVQNAATYMKNRSSKDTTYVFHTEQDKIYVMANTALIEWVVENIWKNAIDAMQGSGTLTIEIGQENNHVTIDITDTGKGLPRNKFKTIFKPGFTTKSRGWGLGLSLAQRIIQEYHHGKISVKSSEIDKGTTIRINLPIVNV